MSENTSTRLTGRNLAAVLIVVAVCLTAMGLMALYKDIDGAMMSIVVGSLAAIGGLATGRMLPLK